MNKKIEFVKIENLHFDFDNPRLPKSAQGARSEDKIIDYMVKSGNIIELMASIVENGYFEAEPLLVVPKKDGDYKVVEGNRRLAALKLLNAPSLTSLRTKAIQEIIDIADGKIPESAPCIVYDSENEIVDYLGFRHITGVKDWGALEKARYLDRLYEQHKDDLVQQGIYTKLAKMIGSRSDYVRRLHTALKLYEYANNEAYYGLDIVDSDVDFSWITTALGYKSIADYLGFVNKDFSFDELNKDHFKKLFIWMFDPVKSVIKESRQISALAKVIGSNEALERLGTGGQLSEAILYTTDPSDVFMNLLQDAKEKMQQAKMAIEQLNEEPVGAQHLLKEIEKINRTIKGALLVNYNPELRKVMSNPLDEEILGKYKEVISLILNGD